MGAIACSDGVMRNLAFSPQFERFMEIEREKKMEDEEYDEVEWDRQLAEARREYDFRVLLNDGTECICADAGKCMYCNEKAIERGEMLMDRMRDEGGRI